MQFRPLALLYLVILLDILLNNAAEPQYSNIGTVILISCFEIALPFFALVLFYIIFMNTTLMKQGSEFMQVFKSFYGLFFAGLLHFVVLLAIRGLRVADLSANTPYLMIWHRPAYFWFFFFQKIVGVTYYCTCFDAIRRIMDPALLVTQLKQQTS